MIQLRNIRMEIGEDLSELKKKSANKLRLDPRDIAELKILKKSVDARKKQDIHYIYTVAVDTGKHEKALLKKGFEAYVPFSYDIPAVSAENRPVVVGFGPAGMFCALILARAGLKPVVLERGDCVEDRMKLVEEFWNGGILDSESNVQFGEGGAGTFSDGKLNTGTNNPRISYVLETLHHFGADESITYDAKPHVGTDVLVDVVRNLRNEVVSLGGSVQFRHRFVDFSKENDRLTVLCETENGTVTYETSNLVLALGHSSRDTLEMLYEKGVSMQAKSFSMGVRIEHPQKLIDQAQYGGAKGLPPADYKLNCRTESGSAYTFCMCPGGCVVAAASEENSIVTNGMSYRARDMENANAALLVSVSPEDFPNNSLLSGMYWQRSIEQAAYAFSGSYKAPAQLVGDFLSNTPSENKKSISPSYRPGVVYGDLRKVLPKKITDTIAEALPVLGRKLKGFDRPDAILTAPETRSSSPVRIQRGDDRMSISTPMLYPCGEGAGYAGGITSAAVDGMKTAEAIINSVLLSQKKEPHVFAEIPAK